MGVIVWGRRLYGKIHQVDKNIHVATVFFYLQFIPLVPLESWVIVSKSGAGWRGFKLDKLMWRSVLVAWLRTALVIVGLPCLAAGLAGALGGGVAALAESPDVLIGGILGVGAVVGFILSYKLTRADADTIVELGRVSGLKDDEIMRLIGRDPAQLRGAGPTSPTAM